MELHIATLQYYNPSNKCARAPCNIKNSKRHSTRVFCSFLVGTSHVPLTLKDKATSILCYVVYVHIDLQRLQAHHAFRVSVVFHFMLHPHSCSVWLLSILQTVFAHKGFMPGPVQHISLSVLGMQYHHLQGFDFWSVEPAGARLFFASKQESFWFPPRLSVLSCTSWSVRWLVDLLGRLTFPSR